MTIQFDPKTGARGIEWTDETDNPIGGCPHGCKWIMPDGTGTIVDCWAEDLAEHGVAKPAYPEGFDHHYWRPHLLKSLAAGDEPQLRFCGSMTDLGAPNVPEEHARAVLRAMHGAPHHVFQMLTKAAPKLLKYADEMPPNLWVGVSSPPDFFMGHRLLQNQQKKMLRRSLEVLDEVKERTGNIVWMSAEPVSWDLADVIGVDHPLDWIVIGAASHRRKLYQPDVEHIRRLLEIMDATETPVFFKGNIKPLFEEHDLGSKILNRWREDFPARYRDGKLIKAVARRQKLCREHGWTRSKLYIPRSSALQV